MPNSFFKRFFGRTTRPTQDSAVFASSVDASPDLSGVMAYGPGGIVQIAGTTGTFRAATGEIAYRVVIEMTAQSDAASDVRVQVTASDGSVIMVKEFKTLTAAQPTFDAWLKMFCDMTAGQNAGGSTVRTKAATRVALVWARRALITAAVIFVALYVMGVALNLSRHAAGATPSAMSDAGNAPVAAAGSDASLAPVWPVATATASSDQPQPAADTGTRVALSASDTQAVKSATSILAHGKPTDPPYWVFEAATCPACQAADAQFSLLDGWSEHVIPVGFTPQDKTMAAAALCAQDPAYAWHLAMIGAGAGLTKTCKAGLDAVEKNNALFLKLGFTATPTLMTSSGHLGVGSASASVLRQWLTENSKR